MSGVDKLFGEGCSGDLREWRTATLKETRLLEISRQKSPNGMALVNRLEHSWEDLKKSTLFCSSDRWTDTVGMEWGWRIRRR